MTHEEQQKIEDLGARAEQIAAAYAERETAIEEAKVAEAALLEAVIARVRPALRAIGRRQIVCEQDGEERMTSERYVVLTSDRLYPSRLRRRLDDTSGICDGADVAITDSGKIMIAEYAGTWSQWQGGISDWEATLRVASAREVCRVWKVDHMIARISEELAEKDAGKIAARTQAARDRAAKISAITALLGSNAR